ncbi:MAG: hypothetical protein OM95_15900 [Bdellovibrio sp. ArHS]|uniref:response regulator transcription factor n=1 Tax=Bdellovibrio sp. ArHS TaxID=1569284 RepID=UPI000583F711|nr:response regulator transcription factor [Bdellovibrio sp. ArHS]KHD87176.1 MAG: hypothetical protein OM95_15900 [Bdellovibrio sp. ArHS]
MPLNEVILNVYFHDIIICEDHPICATGVEVFLTRALGYAPTIHKVHSGRQLINALSERAVDLVILDLILPDASGLDLLEHLQKMPKHIPVIIISSCEDTSVLNKVQEKGVQALLSKLHSEEIFRRALESASLNAQTFIDPQIAQLLAKPRGEGLTPREWEVLVLIAQGHTNESISRALGCSVETVKTHRAKLGQKTATRNRAELTAWYLQRK